MLASPVTSKVSNRGSLSCAGSKRWISAVTVMVSIVILYFSQCELGLVLRSRGLLSHARLHRPLLDSQPAAIRAHPEIRRPFGVELREIGAIERAARLPSLNGRRSHGFADVEDVLELD